jgi:hypothetical protein
MAADLRKQGFQGITTDSTYDAWTPSRAYSHYHGGVRILSETASCKLATPVTVKFEELRPGLGYDPRKEAANFGPVWQGGEWHIGDITRYMTSAAFSLLQHASDNREKWLSRFYQIGKEAVRPRKDNEIYAYVFKNETQSFELDEILKRGGVETDYSNRVTENGKTREEAVYGVRLAQPYGAFAKALLESQQYPHLVDASGSPIPPYDVTAHTLSLLFGVQAFPVKQGYRFSYIEPKSRGDNGAAGCDPFPIPTGIYRSYMPAMDEGWTRFVADKLAWRFMGCSHIERQEMRNADVRRLDYVQSGSSAPVGKLSALIFPDQSPNAILNGFAKGTMPEEYTGGVGKEGVENLKKFVEAGGTLVFLNRSSDFAIEQFNLPIKDVTRGLARKDFYIPGSILRTELDTISPMGQRIAKGMPKESIAWFEASPAFEFTGMSNEQNYFAVARYPKDPKNVLLSGWALGAEKIAGKDALVVYAMGKGKIVLFGFRPQYRGQSLATFPLLFNAIAN